MAGTPRRCQHGNFFVFSQKPTAPLSFPNCCIYHQPFSACSLPHPTRTCQNRTLCSAPLTSRSLSSSASYRSQQPGHNDWVLQPFIAPESSLRSGRHLKCPQKKLEPHSHLLHHGHAPYVPASSRRCCERTWLSLSQEKAGFHCGFCQIIGGQGGVFFPQLLICFLL